MEVLNGQTAGGGSTHHSPEKFESSTASRYKIKQIPNQSDHLNDGKQNGQNGALQLFFDAVKRLDKRLNNERMQKVNTVSEAMMYTSSITLALPKVKRKEWPLDWPSIRR